MREIRIDRETRIIGRKRFVSPIMREMWIIATKRATTAIVREMRMMRISGPKRMRM